MAQQRYIYPPTTVSGLQAMYNSPVIASGFTSINVEILKYKLLYDRDVTDILELPFNIEQIQLAPNELATSISIYNIIDHLNKNFLYLNTRSTLASNNLPGEYKGYYKSTALIDGNPVFVEDTPSTPSFLPLTAIDAGSVIIDTVSTPLSSVRNGASLNDTTTGVWLRDSSLIDTSTLSTSAESYHYGFLCSPNILTVVKMANKPQDGNVSYDANGEISGSGGWAVIDNYTNIQTLPENKNTIKFNNISKIKTDNKKYIYVLDSGISRPGIENVSTSSRRSVIYKYDVSGYLNINNNNTIQKNNLILSNTLGDLNTITNESDVINPTALTIDSHDNIIIYDDFDYTFKIFDKDNNFKGKYPKRTIFFRGAPGEVKKYRDVADIHYDNDTSQLYVLSPGGYMFIFDDNFNLKTKFIVPKGDNNQSKNLTDADISHEYYSPGSPGNKIREQFIQLEFSINENNVYYILTTNRLIKKFKSRNNNTVGIYNFIDNDIGILTQQDGKSYRVSPKFISIIQEANIVSKVMVNSDNEIVNMIDSDRTYTYDQLYLYTDFIDVQSSARTGSRDLNHNYILSFQERDNTISTLTKKNYTIYDISDISSITHREYTSDLIYNKVLHKLISNHTKMIKLISYHIAGKYTSTGELIYDSQQYIQESEYRQLTLDIDESYYMGINEYLSTATLNRCFSRVFNLQKLILNTIQLLKLNTWPSTDINVSIEPFLHTSGEEYMTIDDTSYTGYYYIRSQTGGDITIAGRGDTDGSQLPSGAPSTDRYLTLIQTG